MCFARLPSSPRGQASHKISKNDAIMRSAGAASQVCTCPACILPFESLFLVQSILKLFNQMTKTNSRLFFRKNKEKAMQLFRCLAVSTQLPSFTTHQTEQMQSYMRLLMEQNEVMNLTGYFLNSPLPTALANEVNFFPLLFHLESRMQYRCALINVGSSRELRPCSIPTLSSKTKFCALIVGGFSPRF